MRAHVKVHSPLEFGRCAVALFVHKHDYRLTVAGLGVERLLAGSTGLGQGDFT